MLTRCAKCLYWSNHPLGITFDSSGVCSGCLVHEEKNQLDWVQRKIELKKIFESRSGQSNYDCVIPVSGGQDSFFTVHYAINELGLNPLLVNFNRNFNSKEGIRNLSILRSVFDADYRQFTIGLTLAKSIISCTLSNLGSLNWLWIAGQTSLPVRIAIDLEIPFVLWGAHQGLEQVGMYSHLENVEMSRRYRQEHDLMGFDEERILDFNPNFTNDDLSPIRYPSDLELHRSEVRGIYLGNFVRWDPTFQHEQMNRLYGYGSRNNVRAFWPYDNPDCPVYFGLNDILKQAKYGYSKATDQLTREIRHGRISRTVALKLEKKFLSQRPEGISEFARWMGVSEKTINLLLLQHAGDFSSSVLAGDWIDRPFQDALRNRFRGLFSNSTFLDSDYQNIGKGI